MKEKLISSVTLTVLLVLVALPLLFIVLQAIFPHFSAGSLSGALTGVPMLLADPQLLPMLGGTLWVASGVALMSVVIGLPLGVLRGLFNVPLPRLWDLLFLIPFLTPPYIAALSWMLVLQSNGYLQQLTGWDLNDLLFSRGGIVLVMTFNIFPGVYFAVSRSLLASGQRLAIVARVHGASAWFCRFAQPAGERSAVGDCRPGARRQRLAGVLAHHAADAFPGAGGGDAAGVYPGN